MRWGREEHKSKQREKQHQQQQLDKKHTEKQQNQRLEKNLPDKQQSRQKLPPLQHQRQQQSHKHREQSPQPPQSNHHHQQQHYHHQRLHDKEDQQQKPPHHHQHPQDKEGSHHHHQERQQEKEARSSSSSTPFSLFAPTSWISKLKHTLHSSKNASTKSQQDTIPKRHHHHLNSPDPRIKPYQPGAATQQNSNHYHRRKLDASARPRPTTTASPPPAGSKSYQVQPLSPTHPARISSVSDHYISFLPADLDDGVFLPTRHSYEKMPPGPGPNGGLHDANGERSGRRRGLSFAFDAFGPSSHAAVPQLRRSESAKLTRIASDHTTASSSSQHRKPSRSRRDDFFSLFSAVPDTISRINTTTPSQSSSSMSTCTTAPAAPRGPMSSPDLAHHVPEPSRSSFSGGTGHRLRRRSKLRVHSPRVAAGATKKKPAKEVAEMLVHRKTAEAATVGGNTTAAAAAAALESFAVVKCSSDPRRDFRDSMLEMITELGMARPDQLEGLLACYLSLNADEYHDVIVRVFRQVWLDLILDTASSTSPTHHHHQRPSA